MLNKYHHGGAVPEGAINIMSRSAYGNPFVTGNDGDGFICQLKIENDHAPKADFHLAWATVKVDGHQLTSEGHTIAIHKEVLVDLP